MTSDDLALEIVRLLRAQRYRFADERGLQDGIAVVLAGAGRPFVREARLGEAGVVDFLVGAAPAVGVEVKVQGGLAAVTRQLFGYAGRPEVDALVLVTPRAAHRRLPPTLAGKPVHVCHLLLGAL